MSMTSNKPYLIRAIYEWINDNNLTPYILVNAEYPGVQVPLDFVKEGKIVLNMSPKACRGLHMNNERIVFSARFAGKVEQIAFSPSAVIAIYAKENGRGMDFGIETTEPVEEPSTNEDKTHKKKPFLTLIKNDNDKG